MRKRRREGERGRKEKDGKRETEKCIREGVMTATVLQQPVTMGRWGVALGPEVPAAFSTDESLLAALRINGEEEADPIWPLPNWSDHSSSLLSGLPFGPSRVRMKAPVFGS